MLMSIQYFLQRGMLRVHWDMRLRVRRYWRGRLVGVCVVIWGPRYVVPRCLHHTKSPVLGFTQYGGHTAFGAEGNEVLRIVTTRSQVKMFELVSPFI